MRGRASLCVFLFSAVVLAGSDRAFGGRGGGEIRKLSVREVARAVPDADEAYLADPVAAVFSGGRLYISDRTDHAVKVYSRDGAFIKRIGRHGAGPGELNGPGGLDVFNGRLFVSDMSNRRIQVFSPAGEFLYSIPVEGVPLDMRVLAEDTILLVYPPPGRRPMERPGLLALIDFQGKRRSSFLEAVLSGDPLRDNLLNLVNAFPDGTGGFFVAYKMNRREIRRFDGFGREAGRFTVDGRYPRLELRVHLPELTLRIEPFCLCGRALGGRLYLLVPGIEPGRDTGPGNRIMVLDGGGGLEAEIDLPVPVVGIEAADDRLYAIDADYDLRVFEIER